VTTLPGALAAIQGIEALRRVMPAPRPLQDYHAPPAAPEQLRLADVVVDHDPSRVAG
jgi:hypothetical protein